MKLESYHRKYSNTLKYTLSKLYSMVKTELQLLRRLEEMNEYEVCYCATCGRPKHYQNIDGGHCMPVGNSINKMGVDKRSVYPQCVNCNKWNHGEIEKFKLFMDHNYPGVWNKLKELEKEQIDRTELIELLFDYRMQVKKIKPS